MLATQATETSPIKHLFGIAYFLVQWLWPNDCLILNQCNVVPLTVVPKRPPNLLLATLGTQLCLLCRICNQINPQVLISPRVVSVPSSWYWPPSSVLWMPDLLFSLWPAGTGRSLEYPSPHDPESEHRNLWNMNELSWMLINNTSFMVWLLV